MGNIPWDGTAHICISHETVAYVIATSLRQS